MSPPKTTPDFVRPVPVARPPVRTTVSAIRAEQRRSCRVVQASRAINDLVKAHGLATPGDLMAVLGVETMPRLLAMLGFTGDLASLAGELAVLAGDSPGEEQ